jgi:hypothetical protein
VKNVLKGPYMAKCANCNLYAEYVIEHTGADSQTYCDKHLPWHVNRKKLPPHVKNITAQPVVAPVVEPVVETPIIETPVAPVVEEAVPVVEEVKPVAPKPKAKKAKVQDENRTNTDEAGASSSEISTQP